MRRLGIDLGGTKTEVIALDESGAECFRSRKPTPAADYEAILQTITSLVSDASEGGDYTLGLGIPGVVSRKTGLVKNANTTVLIGKPLQKDLEDRLGRPVFIENDANCFALSEAVDGAGAGAETVFGVILGTGVGGGLVSGKKILPGRNQIAGEWGHNPLPWPLPTELPGDLCYCGKTGCIETWLSGPGMKRHFLRATGKESDPANIFRLAREGDLECRMAREAYTDRLARSLATVINIFDPEVTVLGGGLSNVEGLAEECAEKLPARVFSDAVETVVVRNRHGDSSGVRGAAWLASGSP